MFLRINSPFRKSSFDRWHFFSSLYFLPCNLILGTLGCWKCGESPISPRKCSVLLWLVLNSIVYKNFLQYTMSGEAVFHNFNNRIRVSFLEFVDFWPHCIVIYNDYVLLAAVVEQIRSKFSPQCWWYVVCFPRFTWLQRKKFGTFFTFPDHLFNAIGDVWPGQALTGSSFAIANTHVFFIDAFQHISTKYSWNSNSLVDLLGMSYCGDHSSMIAPLDSTCLFE